MNDSVKSLVEVSTRTINGKEVLAVTSLQVAEHFGKEHKHVLRDIEAVLSQVPENFVKPNFGLYEYPVETGIGTRTAKAYLLSKDAFTLLTMGYTGEKAMAFKIAYIARFNEMEEQLRTTSPLLPNFRDPIAAARAWADEYEAKQRSALILLKRMSKPPFLDRFGGFALSESCELN